MTERVVRAMSRGDLWRDHQAMHRRRLEVLESYELIGSPVVTSTRLAYVPWVQQAVQPYAANRLPNGPAQGIWKALHRARLAPAPPNAGAVEAA